MAIDQHKIQQQGSPSVQNVQTDDKLQEKNNLKCLSKVLGYLFCQNSFIVL